MICIYVCVPNHLSELSSSVGEEKSVGIVLECAKIFRSSKIQVVYRFYGLHRLYRRCMHGGRILISK